MRITTFARTDVGRVRPDNEDDYFVGGQVFAVADGMGGHVGGEVAAKTALEPLVDIDQETFDSPESAEEALVEALRAANRQVVEKAQAQPELQGMGTTLTAGLLREGRLHLAHVGDSRAYLLRDDDTITQLTTDHTFVERLVRDGRLSRDEAATHPQRNVVTRAIGNEADVVVDSLPPLYLQPGDQVLLCSDGLTGSLEDDEIAGILAAHADGEDAVAALVDEANEAGGHDNITVVLLRVDGKARGAAGPSGASSSSVRRIQTRQDSGTSDWANRLGQLAAPQGAPKGRVKSRERRSGGGKRFLAGLLAVLLLAGIVAGGGYVLLSRAYFVGVHEGQVAIFRGVPQEVGTMPLHRVIPDEVTGMPLEEFPAWRQSQIENGITASTIGEARRYVTNLERSIDWQPPDEEESDAEQLDGTEDGQDDEDDEGA